MELTRLVQWRQRAALTQRELASMARVTQMTVWRAEHGKDVRPTTIRKLAKALKVKPAELMGPTVEEGR